jgi:hypothetical protein
MRHARFALEAIDAHRIVCQRGWQNLERDIPASVVSRAR